MKKIVKNGKIECHKIYPLFVCPVCKCEFYAEKMPQDYEQISYFDEDPLSNPYRAKNISTFLLVLVVKFLK